MSDLGSYLARTSEAAGQPLRLEIGEVLGWTAPGNNLIQVLGGTAQDVRALAGLSFVIGDTVALLKSRGGYLAIGKVV